MEKHLVDRVAAGGWSQGYVHDLPYSDHFYPELAPVNLNYVALLNGFAPRQLDNLEILEKSFAEMITADLPEFEFIALHGVYSWVSAASRQAILQFISRKLSPGSHPE